MLLFVRLECYQTPTCTHSTQIHFLNYSRQHKSSFPKRKKAQSAMAKWKCANTVSKTGAAHTILYILQCPHCKQFITIPHKYPISLSTSCCVHPLNSKNPSSMVLKVLWKCSSFTTHRMVSHSHGLLQLMLELTSQLVHQHVSRPTSPDSCHLVIFFCLFHCIATSIKNRQDRGKWCSHQVTTQERSIHRKTQKKIVTAPRHWLLSNSCWVANDVPQLPDLPANLNFLQLDSAQLLA